MGNLTFIDLFAGIGGFRRGMELAGHKCIGFCEYDNFAVASYTSMHCITEKQRQYLSTLSIKDRQKEILKPKYRNGEWYAKDIREVKGSNIPRADVWGFGAPCFVAGTLITTQRGQIPIEEVKVGDMVLTHKSRWQRVEETMNHKATGIYTIQVQGSPKTEVTGNHRFYVRYKSKVWDNANRKYKTVYTDPEWKEVSKFTGKELIAFPVVNSMESINDLSNDMLWLLGRYVADGYLCDYPRKDRPSNTMRVVWCIGNDKLDEFRFHIERCGINYSESLFTGCTKFITSNREMFELCSQFGRGAGNKSIPMFIFGLSKEQLHMFISGYIAGDGSNTENFFRATSISRRLIYQLGQLVNTCYGITYQIAYCKRPTKHIIENREVNQHDTWEIKYPMIMGIKSHGIMLNDTLWMPIRKISFDPNRNETVYNLEVENDHSYTANNMGVHNCQDFSIAGIRKGLDGDRSSLIREVYRIISEIPEADRPKYLVYENVKGMLSSNGGWDYAAILIEMAELGYDVYFQNFNSKYYGVPQNRERIYTIGCLRTKCSEKVFSFSGSDEKDNLEGINPKCLGGFGEQNSNGGTQFYQQDRIYDSHTVATSLTNDLPGGSNYYAIDVDSSNQIGHIETENRDNPQRHRVYDVNKAGPTLNTYGGGGQLPEIPVKVDLGDSKQQIIPMNQDCEHQGQLVHNPNGLCSTIRAIEYKDAQKVRIPISVATPPQSQINIMNSDYQHQQEGIHDSIGIASTICARDYKDAQKVAIPIQITPYQKC